VLLLGLALWVSSDSSFLRAEPDPGVPPTSNRTEQDLLTELRIAPIAGPDMRRVFRELSSSLADLPAIFERALSENDQLLAVQLAYAFRKEGRAVAPQVLPILAHAIDEPKLDRKLIGIECAGLVGLMDDNIVRALEAAAQHKERKVRYRSVVALGRLEDRTPAVQTILKKASRDASPIIAARAASLLKASDAIVKNPLPAPAAFASAQPSSSTASPGISPVKLQHSQKSSRDIIRDLKSGDNGVKAQAGMMAAMSKNPDPQIIGMLEKNLHSPDERVRFSASFALGQIGMSALPALTRAMEDPDAAVRLKAVQALKQIEPATDEVVRVIETGLNDEDESVQLQTALALAAVRPSNERAMAILIESLGSNHQSRAAIEPVLKKIDSQAALPNIMNGMKSDDPFMRSGAARALAAIGTHDPELTGELKSLLDDPSPWVRKSAQVALNEINQSAEPTAQ